MEIFGFEGIPLSWILIAGVVTLFYVYGKRRNRVLKDAGIPGPEPTIFIGNFVQILQEARKGIDFDNENKKKYGNVVGSYLGGRPAISVTDADIIREILIKQFQNFTDRMTVPLSDFPIDKGILFETGATWKRLRNIVSPTFSGAKLRLMCDKINECAKRLETKFLKAAETESVIDIKRYFGSFSMDVIASTAFGIEIDDSQSDKHEEFLNEARKVFSEAGIMNPGLIIGTIFPELVPLFRTLGFSTFPKKTLQFFTKVLTEMIEQRKGDADKEKRLDFLQLLLDAEVDDGEGNEKAKKKMSHDEVLGQALLFFIAGYETTGNTLHFAAYSLATNPDVQERLVEEIDTILGERTPGYDNIGELPYLDHVITETLRLYPVVPTLSRHTEETIQIKGYTFPKGCGVVIPTAIIHRDPDIYPEPHRFNPDRWEKKSEMDPMNYLPFGQGPRHCIGMRLAQVEMKIALARVLKKVIFIPAPDTPETLKSTDLQMTALISTKMTIHLKVKAR